MKKKFLFDRGRNISDTPRKTGRPTIYTEANKSRILAGLAQGIPVTQICRKRGAPSRRVVYKWLSEYPDFNKAFRAARWTGYCTLFATLADDVEDMLDAGQSPEVVQSVFEWQARRFKHDRYTRAGLGDHVPEPPPQFRLAG